MSQTQWLGKCVNRKTSLSLWVWDSVMCLHVFWIETINFTCAAVNFGSQVWTGVTLLKLKALLVYEKLYEEVLLEIPVLPEIHTSFKHKNERYVWQKTVTFHASINRHAHRGKRGVLMWVGVYCQALRWCLNSQFTGINCILSSFGESAGGCMSKAIIFMLMPFTDNLY